MRTHDRIGGDQAGSHAVGQAAAALPARAAALAVAALACWAVTIAGLLLFPPSGIALGAVAALATAGWLRCRRALDAIARATARSALPEGW
jgi:hypothetical protein